MNTLKNLVSKFAIPKESIKGGISPKVLMTIVVAIVLVVALLPVIFSPSIGLGNATTGAPGWLITTLSVVVAGILVIKFSDGL